MKLVIAGSRKFVYDYDFLREIILASIGDYKKFPKIKEIVSGGAKGIDLCAKNYAKAWEVNYKEFPAEWDVHGRAAGPIRNKQMAEYSDALLIVWDGESRGSSSMKKEMLKLNKPVYEVILKKHNV